MSIDIDVVNKNIEKLNKEQQQAVFYDKGSSLILAAAGSGKTSTLTNRIAYIIANGLADTSEILAVTFTNKAAKEMRGRLSALGIDVSKLWVGTFHGLCNKVLRAYPELVGYRKNFYIMDQQEQLSYLKRVAKAIGIDSKQNDIGVFQDVINSTKEKGLRADSLPFDTKEKKLFEAYEQACKTDNCMDFAELLLACYELLRDNKDMRVGFQEKFKHILVDEFQDTNELQYNWLTILAGLHKNIFAVGDDDQSIYSFRGAKPENMTKLIRDFNAKTIKIEKNYRSDGFILDAANSLIEKNTKRLGKNLVPIKERRNKIRIKQNLNDKEEGDFIANSIKNYRRVGVRYKNMAILYRTNGQTRALEKSLNSNKVPYVIYGGLRFFERQEVKHVMAYLRLVENEHDNMAFQRVVNIPRRGIGFKALNDLELLAKEHGCSLFDAIDYFDEKNRKKFDTFKRVIENIRQNIKNRKLPDIIKETIVLSGLEDFYQKDEKEGAERLDNVYEIISAGCEFLNENPKSTLSNFIESVSLDADMDAKKQDPNADMVQLMTVHASKGLEFDLVFLAGLEERLFPHINAITSTDPFAVEEERRLMYVALTRAKERLYITYCEERVIHGAKESFLASRFIREIPKGFISRIL